MCLRYVYYKEKEGSSQPTILKLADQDLLLFPNQKIFYIVVISFQPSLLEEVSLQMIQVFTWCNQEK